MDIKEKLFRENWLFTREDVLKSLELYIEHEKMNGESGYSSEVVRNRVKLCEKFIAAVKKCKLPVLTELWWFYEYQFLGNSIELNLSQAEEIEVENDEIKSMTTTVEHTLIKVECDSNAIILLLSNMPSCLELSLLRSGNGLGVGN